jgi:hypothetical protein
LRPLGQHAIVFVVQLFFDPLGQTTNFSLCIDRERFRLKEVQSLSSFVSNRLESLQNFRACHDGLSVGQGRELSLLWYPENEGVRESLGSLIDGASTKVAVPYGEPMFTPWEGKGSNRR